MCFWIEDIASVVMNELYLFDVIVDTVAWVYFERY